MQAERRRKFDSAVLIGLSASIAAIIVLSGFYLYSKKMIFPGAADRYDITEVRVAILEDVCGTELSAKAYESCLPNLDPESAPWVRMELPDFDWIQENRRPRFGGILYGFDENTWRRIYRERETSITAIKIPGEHFRRSDHDPDFSSLAFSTAYHSIICVDGRCNQRSSSWSLDYNMTIPLLTLEEPGEYAYVFLISRHNEGAGTINLEHGVFVAKDRFFERVNRLYPINDRIGELGQTFLLIGLCIILVALAWYWRGHSEYSAFLYFVASLALVTPIRSLDESSVDFFDSVLAFSVKTCLDDVVWLNIAVAASYFALASSQWPRLSLLRHIALPLGVGITIILSIILFPEEAWQQNARKEIDVSIVVLLALVPVSIFAYRAFVLNKFLRKTPHLAENSQSYLTLKRRRDQQFIFLVLFALFSFPIAYAAMWHYVGYHFLPELTPLNSVLVVAMFVNLAYPHIVKLYRTEEIKLSYDFTQMLAHDVRKPLNFMRIALDRIEQNKDDDARKVLEELKPTLVSASLRADNIVEEILSGDTSIRVNARRVSLSEVIDAAILETAVEQRGIPLSVNAQHSLDIQADYVKMIRVISNLIENAAKYMDDSGTISIATADARRTGQAWVSVSVNNTGSFISEDEIQWIFEPFVSKRRSPGLGLSIVHRIVEAHGGEVTVTSSKEAGTTFKFLVPAVATGSSVAGEEDSIKVALVDDEVFVREAWRQALPEAVLDVFACPEDFMEFHRDNANIYSHVITDLVFENSALNGVDVAKFVNANSQAVIVLCSDYAADIDSGELGVFDRSIPKKTINLAQIRNIRRTENSSRP